MPSWKKLIISGSDAAIPSVSNTGDFTIDAGGDIILDADGTDIVLKDGGTSFGSFKRASSDFIIKAETQDKDILLKGNDGGATITALQLDMSDAGSAIFNNNLTLSVAKRLYFGGGNHTYISEDIDDRLRFFTGGAEFMRFTEAGTDQINLYQDTIITGDLNTSGNISGSQIEASGDVIAFSSSDRRFKDNLVVIEGSLDKIGKVNGYEFDWNDKQSAYKGHDIGVVAQEIEAVLPEVVTTRGDGYKAVKYEKIVPLLIESIKELKQEVDEIKQKCDCLNK
jgi:hypothetical protein